MKLKCLLILWLLSSATIQMSAQENSERGLDFMVGDWDISAKIRNSPISYAEGQGTVKAYFRQDTLFADMDIQFPNFTVKGVTKRRYNQQSKQWDISWHPSNQPNVTIIEGKFKNGRFIEFNYGEDFHSPFLGRLVISDISKDHFSVRKDRLYDDGVLMEEIWVYEATRTK